MWDMADRALTVDNVCNEEHILYTEYMCLYCGLWIYWYLCLVICTYE